MLLNMLDYYRMTTDHNVDIVYSGALWAEGIEGIGATLKKSMAFNEMSLTASQSVFSVFIEQLNNMLMYSAEREVMEGYDQPVPKGVFILASKGKVYYAQSGNVMKAENMELVKGRIDFLNSLDKKALRKYYKEQIKGENTNPESRGAGIGLTEIAKRASGPIEYSFTDYGEGLVFFSMNVQIG